MDCSYHLHHFSIRSTFDPGQEQRSIIGFRFNIIFTDPHKFSEAASLQVTAKRVGKRGWQLQYWHISLKDTAKSSWGWPKISAKSGRDFFCERLMRNPKINFQAVQFLDQHGIPFPHEHPSSQSRVGKNKNGTTEQQRQQKQGDVVWFCLFLFVFAYLHFLLGWVGGYLFCTYIFPRETTKYKIHIPLVSIHLKHKRQIGSSPEAGV